MTQPFEESAELRSLLDALCEEVITPEQLRRLEELVLTHAEAEAFYVQYINMHADVSRHFAALSGTAQRKSFGVMPLPPGSERLAVVAPPPPAPGRPRWFLFGGVLGLTGMAAGLLLALALWRSRPDPTPVNPPPEALDDTVAVLLQAPGAVWAETDLAVRAGAPLAPCWLRLKSGFAHIEFYSGATVILEGPAELKLVSRTEAYCARGKLRANVPPQAQGFTIGSPKLDLVDRGTEFGLQVDGNDRTEVHVFRGGVDLYEAGSDRSAPPRQALATGQSVCVEGPGASRPIRLDPAAFRTAEFLAERGRAEAKSRQEDWQASSETVRTAPGLVVYYPFQADKNNTWSRNLADRAGGRQQPHDGAIVGCAWVTGRWPGKQGLEFRRVSDRVRFHVPGKFDALTLMTWVRVDALPNRYSSLMMTDGWDEGAPHWHIRQDGLISLGVRGADQTEGAARYFTSVIFTQERVGQWTHLAVVYDREGGQVSHYVDGRLVKQLPIKLDIPLHIGDAEIGNWNTASRSDKYPIRYLSGCMDEFLMFSRALSGQEVERLYLQGRPPL
jgi:hypothetical protein